MKQKKTIFQAVSGCLLVLLMPAWAYALNLGDVNLISEPGEPLEAEILLSDVKADEQDSLSVGLADVAGFRWAGIDWSPALNQLQFELQRGADGRDYISIRSDEAVRASSLHFLLKVAWSKGRLFREYTLELGTQAPDTDGQPEDVAAEPAAVPAVGRNWGEVRATVDDTRNYQVVRNDTLWTLARELRPDTSVSIQQMMLALLRTNPDAFSYGNINWLKAGEVLWMPSDFEMQALTQAEAFAEVLAQNNVWRAQRGYATIESGAPGTVAVDGGLRLVAVDEEDLGGDGVTATDPDGIAQGEALVLANEQVEELSLENIELGDKLTEAETIIEDLRRLVELKDDELAALQTQELKEQAEPGPGLPERLGSLYDSTVETLSGPKMQSTFEAATNLARNYWYIALATLALLLAGWLLLRRKFAQDPKGFTVPAASIRPDYGKVVNGEKTDSPAEDDVAEEGADTEELDLVDDLEDEEEDLPDETGAGDDEYPDETEPGEEDYSEETEPEGEDYSEEMEPEEEDYSEEMEPGEEDYSEEMEPEEEDYSEDMEPGEEDIPDGIETEEDDLAEEMETGEADSADEMEAGEEDSTGSAEVEEAEVPDQAGSDDLDPAITGDSETVDDLPEQEQGSDADQEDTEQEPGSDEDQEVTEQEETGDEDQAEAEQVAGGDEEQDYAEQEDEDLVQNKLDLARAYLELGDAENVRSILNEVLTEGNAAQREEARQLLEQADSG